MDRTFIFRVNLESPLLLGSGIGWGTQIDSDIIFDDYGLPLLPARRLKGLLRESAIEVKEILGPAAGQYFDTGSVENLFGTEEQESRLIINNLYPGGLEEYMQVCRWIDWAKNDKHCGGLFVTEKILGGLTSLRQATAINESATAKKHSLRTYRVLNPDVFSFFEGTLQLTASEESALYLLSMATANLRRIGSLRTRGMGKVKCRLFDAAGNDLQAALLDAKGGKNDA